MTAKGDGDHARAACRVLGGIVDGDLIVLKFGSSVLRGPQAVPGAVHEIYRWYRAGWRVAALVTSTDGRHSASSLAIALAEAGIPARIVDTYAPSANDIESLQTLLTRTPVLVIPGDVLMDSRGAPAKSPPRVDTDYTAIDLAHRLRASRCRLLKDVDGIYESDPSSPQTSASLQRFSALGYADALELATAPIDPQAVRLLDQHSAGAEVAALASPYESVIGRFGRTLAQCSAAAPTSVLILGLGQIGGALRERIEAMPEHFQIVGALVRDPAWHLEAAESTPLFDSVVDVLSLRPDIVIDALPGIEPSQAIVSQFLQRGINVITSNLTLAARAGRHLNALAAHHHAHLYYNAAVGGSAPMVGTLRREIHRGEVRSIAAVFSGTASHIVDRCTHPPDGEHLGLHTQLMNAIGGLDEETVHDELSGNIWLRKLRVLARHAFGRGPDVSRAEPLNTDTLTRARVSANENCTLRWVARAWTISHRVFGQLQLEALDTRNPLSQVQPEWNKLLISRADGRQILVQGRGGRGPTVESLLADLLETRFARLSAKPPAYR